MTVAFREAVDAGRAILKDKWQGKYATYDRQFGITELRCGGCGQIIAKHMPVGAQKITRVKNQTIVQEGVALAYLANYREVLLEMRDGSKHVTAACQTCAPLLADPMFAVAKYAADLSQFSSEGARLSDDMCNRSPVRVLKIADSIREQ